MDTIEWNKKYRISYHEYINRIWNDWDDMGWKLEDEEYTAEEKLKMEWPD